MSHGRRKARSRPAAYIRDRYLGGARAAQIAAELTAAGVMSWSTAEVECVIRGAYWPARH